MTHKHKYDIVDLGRLASGQPAPRGANFWLEIDLGFGKPVQKYFAYLNLEGGSRNDIVRIKAHMSELIIPDSSSDLTGSCRRISVEGGRTKIVGSGSGYSGIEIELDEALPLHRVEGTDDSVPGALKGWTRVEHKSRDDR